MPGLESISSQTPPPVIAEEAALMYGPKPRFMPEELADDPYAQTLVDLYEESKPMLARGEWSTVVANFISASDALIPTPAHGEFSIGLLARLLEKSHRLYADDPEPSVAFSFDILSMISKLDHLPEHLLEPRETVIGKRKPSFMESVDGTLRRFRFMEALPSIFGTMTEGIVVGGSMAYGPFYSVRRGGVANDASDVDALFVLRDDFANERNWESILSSNRLAMSDRLNFARRLQAFAGLREKEEVDVISQRFDAPGDDFNMSAHFFPQGVFEQMNGSVLREALDIRKDTVHAIRDFKPKRFEHAVCRQRSFDGEAYEYVVPEQVPMAEGVMAEIPGFMVHEGRLFLGLYQNLISPEFEALYDSSGFTSEVIKGFKDIALGEVRAAQAAGVVANVALSHIRNQVFAPGRYIHRLSDTPALAS